MNRKLLFTIPSVFLMATALHADPFMHVSNGDKTPNDIKVESIQEVRHAVNEKGERVIRMTDANGIEKDYPLDNAKISFDSDYTRASEEISDWTEYPYFPIKREPRDSDYRNRVQEYQEDLASYRAWLNFRNDNPIHYNQEWVTITDSSNVRQMGLFAEIVKESKEPKNFIYSPLSLQFALAMLANGSRENVYEKITKFMGKENWDVEEMNEYFNQIIVRLVSLDGPKIGISNGVWMAKGHIFGQNFLTNLRKWYYANTCNVDFSQDSTYEIMDDWVKERTLGLIEEMSVEKNPSIMMVLANTLYLNAMWMHSFDKEKTDTCSFWNYDSTEVKVPTMHMIDEEQIPVYDGEDYQAVSLAFNNCTFEMEFFLPKKGQSPLDLIDKMDSTKYNSDCYLTLDIPKFSLSDNTNLNDPLTQIDLGILFGIDYPAIANYIMVDKIFQKTKMELDEEGVKAAALTVIIMSGAAPLEIEDKHVHVSLNRPFLFRIKDRQHHTVPFVGIINTLKEEN